MIYKIEKVTPKSNNLLVHFENSDDKLLVSLDDYLAYGINKKEDLKEKDYQFLKEKEVVLIAYDKCLKKLSLKDYSEAKIKEFLKNSYELKEDDIKTIVNKLKNFNYINDERYISNKVELLNNKKTSSKEIKNKLKIEGINEELINKYVNNDNEGDKAKYLASKLNKSIKNKSLHIKKQLIVQRLRQEGFNNSDINEAVNSLDFKEDLLKENDLLLKEALKLKRKYLKKYNGIELNRHLYASLVTKGFKSEDVSRVIEEMRNEDE